MTEALSFQLRFRCCVVEGKIEDRIRLASDPERTVGDHDVGGLDCDWLSMLIFNNRKGEGTGGDVLRYLALSKYLTIECVNHFNQYLDADVPCQKLTEGLEGLYYALASYFRIHNILTPLSANTKSGDKRSQLFEEIWPGIMIIVNGVLMSFAVPGCEECGPRSQIKQCLCLDRIVVLWRIVYL